MKWTPDSGEYHAILQITHGMIEYIERYAQFAEFLTEQGYMVVGHDHLGHGQSVATQEDWGYVGHPKPSDLLVEDMHKLRTLIQGENAEVPYFMLAHSMGSYMLRKYLTIHPEKLKGAIIMGTGMVPDSTTRIGMFTVKFLSIFRGWHYRSKFVADAAFGKPYRRYFMMDSRKMLPRSRKTCHCLLCPGRMIRSGISELVLRRCTICTRMPGSRTSPISCTRRIGMRS